MSDKSQIFPPWDKSPPLDMVDPADGRLKTGEWAGSVIARVKQGESMLVLDPTLVDRECQTMRDSQRERIRKK